MNWTLDTDALRELNRRAKSNGGDGDVLATIFGAILVVVILAVILVPVMAYSIWAYAFVATHLWAWFVVPTFGLPALSMPVAWGLSLLATLYMYHENNTKDNRDSSTKVASFIMLLARPWLVLAFGAMAHHFMK